MPAFSLGKSKRNDGINPINVPGPGSYSQEVHSIVEHSPKWTMSSVKKEEVKNIVPGPGAYNSNLQIIKEKSPTYKMGEKTSNLQSKLQAPGPGQYDPKLSQEKTTFPISFGGKIDYVANKNIAPGPGNYNVGSKEPHTGPKFGTGTRENKFENKKNVLIPGPGRYNSSSFIGETSKYKFTNSKKEVELKDKNPGPGTYNITERVGKEGVKNSLYGRPKSSKSSKIAPGPGAYDPKVKEFVPSYKLSPEIKKSASNILKVPGPGQYQTENTLNLVSALKKAPTWKYHNN